MIKLESPGNSLESILCTDELYRRPSHPPNYEKQNLAFVKLVNTIADSPSAILQTLVETISDTTQCESAGLSLLTKDGKTPDASGQRFYWPAIAGMWNPRVGCAIPRNFSPCGDVLDQNRSLLFTHFERRYTYLLPVCAGAEESLLVPFCMAGEAIGTIWAIMHSDHRRFDTEDERIIACLGKLASSAYEALIRIEHLKFQVSEEALRRLPGLRTDANNAFAKRGALREMLLRCVEAIVRHLDAVFVQIWTLNKDQNMLELQASSGMFTRLDGEYGGIQAGDLKVDWIAKERKPYLTNDVLADPRVCNKDWARTSGVVSFAGYPLIVEERVVGVMALFARHALSNATLDTLSSVADTIAQGIERKRSDEKLRQAEETMRKVRTDLAHVARLATVGELTASITHEVTQPLTAILNNAGASLRWLTAQNLDEVRESIQNVIKDSCRVSDIIQRIRALVKKTPLQQDQLNLNNIVLEVIPLVRAELDMHHVSLQLEMSDDCPIVWGDRIQIQQVMLNLVMNAIEAMSETRGRKTVLIGTAPYDEFHALAWVQDTGPGLHPTQLNRSFEAFYSTKPQGLGMGLAISRSIIEAHGGRLWAETVESGGALFQLTLPNVGGVKQAQRISKP